MINPAVKAVLDSASVLAVPSEKDRVKEQLVARKIEESSAAGRFPAYPVHPSHTNQRSNSMNRELENKSGHYGNSAVQSTNIPTRTHNDQKSYVKPAVQSASYSDCRNLQQQQQHHHQQQQQQHQLQHQQQHQQQHQHSQSEYQNRNPAQQQQQQQQFHQLSAPINCIDDDDFEFSEADLAKLLLLERGLKTVPSVPYTPSTPATSDAPSLPYVCNPVGTLPKAYLPNLTAAKIAPYAVLKREDMSGKENIHPAINNLHSWKSDPKKSDDLYPFGDRALGGMKRPFNEVHMNGQDSYVHSSDRLSKGPRLDVSYIAPLQGTSISMHSSNQSNLPSNSSHSNTQYNTLSNPQVITSTSGRCADSTQGPFPNFQGVVPGPGTGVGSGPGRETPLLEGIVCVRLVALDVMDDPYNRIKSIICFNTAQNR